ncbi:MAG: AMP-binding protein, partial [Actinobacteria bacterium]|nr:AMP-binding protein [Actinomycetota bacterium]
MGGVQEQGRWPASGWHRAEEQARRPSSGWDRGEGACALGRTYEELSRLTAWQVLERTAARLPDKVAVIEGDRRLCYSELLAESARQAAGFARSGLAKGDVAAVYLPNSIELVTIFYALQKLGVVVAWLNPSYRQTEARFILENSGAKAVFLREEWQGFDYLAAVLGLSPPPDLETIVVVRPRDGFKVPDPRVRTLAEVRESAAVAGAAGPSPVAGAAGPSPVAGAAGPSPVAGAAAGPSPVADPTAEPLSVADPTAEPLPAAVHPADVGPEDLSMLIYTSGTTGRPKGAMIGQSQVVRAGFSYSLGVDATEDDVFIGMLPMSHSYGCGALLVQPFLLGATLALLDVFSPPAAFALIEKEKVTLQLGAPAHYTLELAYPQRRDYDLSSLRAGLIAGQIAPAGLITQVEREMGIYISSFLGSSEVGPGLSLILPYQTPLAVRERAVGYPIPGTEARVADPVTGEELGPGEQGELLLSGWHVTRGYWRNPEETAHQIRDGRLHTGDLVTRDEDGCFRILGRLKELINRGGFKIVPSEIESLLVQHPSVAEVCVVGTPNPVLGESICACVRLEEGSPCPTLDEVRGYLEGKLAPFKLPDELLVLPDLPRLPG